MIIELVADTKFWPRLFDNKKKKKKETDKVLGIPDNGIHLLQVPVRSGFAPEECVVIGLNRAYSGKARITAKLSPAASDRPRSALSPPARSRFSVWRQAL